MFLLSPRTPCHDVPTSHDSIFLHNALMSPIQKPMRPNHVYYVCHELYAFTNDSSWLMKFFKIVKKMKKCVAMKENCFQTFD